MKTNKNISILVTTILCLSGSDLRAQGSTGLTARVQDQTTAQFDFGRIPTKTVSQHGRYVALSSSGALLHSMDGQTWRPAKLSFRTFLRDVTIGGGLFVAVGGSYV